MTNIMIRAEKDCAPSQNTKNPWSMQLKEKGLIYRYWNLRLRQLDDLPVSQVQVTSLKQYLNLQDITTERYQVIIQKIGRKEYMKLEKIAADIRQKELELRATEYGLAGQTNKEKIVKMIADREQMRLEYRYLRNLLTTMRKQSITSIAIPKSDGTTKILKTP